MRQPIQTNPADAGSELVGSQPSLSLPVVRVMVFLAGFISLLLGMSRLYEFAHDPEKPDWQFFLGVFLFVLLLDVSLGWLHKRKGYKPKYCLHIISFTVLTSLWILSTRTTVYLIDDSFYYLEIAYNIVHHHWSTFDKIVTTNGYHPLWMFCLVAIEYLSSVFHLHDPILFIRLTHTVQIGILSGSVYAIYLHLKRVLPPTPAMLFSLGYLAFPYVRLNALNGMESGLLAMLLLWSHYLLTANSRPRSARYLSCILLVLITLTRIEVGILWSAVYLGYTVLWKENSPFKKLRTVLEPVTATPCQEKNLFGIWSISFGKKALAILVSVIVGVALSVGYNYAIAGMPMSYAGDLKREWSRQSLLSLSELPFLQQVFVLFQASVTATVFEYPAWVLKRPLEFIFVTFGDELKAARPFLVFTWISTVLTALLVVFGGVAWQWKKCKNVLVQTRLWVFVLFSFVLTGIYKYLLFAPAYVLGGGRSDHQGWWYHHPLNTAVYFLVISALAGLYLSVSFRRRIARLVLLVIPIGLLVTQVCEASVLYHNAPLRYSDFYDAVNQALLRGEPIKCILGGGGRDAFALTYQGVTVINTDGLVNSPEYTERVRSDGEVVPYMQSQHCEYLMAPYDDPTGTGIVKDRDSVVFVQRGRYLVGRSTYGQYSSNAIWKLVIEE